MLARTNDSHASYFLYGHNILNIGQRTICDVMTADSMDEFTLTIAKKHCNILRIGESY